MLDSDLRESDGLRNLLSCIGEAQERFAELLKSYLLEHPTTVDQYIRYLSFQYHLTKDVQRYFLAIAAHGDLARRRGLRDFLCSFANEEELHYLVAANDLAKLGLRPLPMPFDVELWHTYFSKVVVERPFVRLGAAAILENISDGVAKEWVRKALQGSFLTRDNTKFLVLHQHEALPHGQQILAAIEEAHLEPGHFADLNEGARKGTVLYLRMAEWAIRPHTLSSICDRDTLDLDHCEEERIRTFSMEELGSQAA
ncbi:iron-containing redox enzyme family protein [Reyranella sp.]|uniref:iron-containing redox enzyme family protein n=1 Tax=Reyranella sp. TaxID=1929291 RepID=UPI0025EB0F5D|nr:iron-containing redox enzyme family protein [Reyranella sp.]